MLRIRNLLFASVLMLAAAARAETKVQEVDVGYGVTAWVIEDHTIPVVHAAFSFRNCGSVSDTEPTQGRAHMSAAMLLEGTQQKSARAFQEAMEEKAISLDFGAGQDVFSANVHTLTENQGAAFALLTEALSQAKLDEESLARVKSQMQAQIKLMETEPEYLAARAWDKMMYGDHPYAYSGIGTPQTIQKLTASDAQQFISGCLARGNLLITVSGDVNAETLKQQLGELVAALPEKQTIGKDIPQAKLAVSGEYQAITRAAPQDAVHFGIKGITRHDKHFYAAYVLADIMGGMGLDSVLQQKLREENGLTYHADLALDPSLYAATLQGSFTVRHEDATKAIKLLNQTLAEVSQKGFTQQQVEDAKQNIMGSFAFKLDSNAEAAGFLMVMRLYDLGIDYLSKRNDYFKDVTVEQVNALAPTLLDHKHMIMVRVGGKE